VKLLHIKHSDQLNIFFWSHALQKNNLNCGENTIVNFIQPANYKSVTTFANARKLLL
jgi:hypothetical protein